MKWKLANYVSVIDESWDAKIKIKILNEAGVFQLHAFPDLTPFIVFSEETRVVQANFASTPNASAIVALQIQTQ